MLLGIRFSVDQIARIRTSHSKGLSFVAKVNKEALLCTPNFFIDIAEDLYQRLVEFLHNPNMKCMHISIPANVVSLPFNCGLCECDVCVMSPSYYNEKNNKRRRKSLCIVAKGVKNADKVLNTLEVMDNMDYTSASSCSKEEFEEDPVGIADAVVPGATAMPEETVADVFAAWPELAWLDFNLMP